uniref:Uncharacterized protein n=1 Tax=Glossina pallidipes TaxID=7398 RepID=A0A1B0AGR7_GLOPL
MQVTVGVVELFAISNCDNPRLTLLALHSIMYIPNLLFLTTFKAKDAIRMRTALMLKGEKLSSGFSFEILLESQAVAYAMLCVYCNRLSTYVACLSILEEEGVLVECMNKFN